MKDYNFILTEHLDMPDGSSVLKEEFKNEHPERYDIYHFNAKASTFKIWAKGELGLDLEMVSVVKNEAV